MEQLVQCPVCTLFLHNGMTLESHLDTHPKDQVIKALCTLSANNVGFGSRTSTPMHSERSYRSRSRTPAEDSPRWSSSHRSIDNERYWRRTPSRSSKTPVSSITRNATPSDVRIGDLNFENNSNNASANHYPGLPFMKADKPSQPFIQNLPVPEFDQQYIYYPDQQEDKEIKYSRSAEYSAIDNTNNVFTYNMPPLAPGVKLQTALLPGSSRRGNDLVKILPKPNNILVKTNMGGVQYITPGVKPVHVMVPTAPTFVQKNVQNNMIVSGSIPTTQILEPKTVASPCTSSNSQFNQLTSGTFTPGTTVVTQNSQLIYREMVHNIDGKPFITSMPAVLSSHDNVTNVAATSSIYQNVMVVDQFGNTSCMYTTPQPILSKPCSTPLYSDVSVSNIEKSVPNSMVTDPNKTLIIEVGPIVAPTPIDACTTTSTSQASQTVSETSVTTALPEKLLERNESRNDTPGPSKGLKILSNIKVEVPVQHHKNLLNTVVDLTGSQEPEYADRSASPERILPDFEDNNHSLSRDCMQPSATSNDSIASNTFSVIKNVGNPPSYKDSVSKSCVVDNKIENEFTDSCPMPDLICKEKPSISPCSELSENGDNSTDRISISPKPEIAPPLIETTVENAKPAPQKPHRSIPLRLNNIYVKKHKKILEIKNSKSYSVSPTKDSQVEKSSPVRPPENFTMNKIHSVDENKDKTAQLQTVAVEVFNDSDTHHEFDADTEEQSMDIEPVAHSSISHSTHYSGVNMVQVKEEINTSNEGGFSNGTGTSDRDLTPLESMRPINVISYGNLAADDFDDESNHKELLELEAASKNNKFVSMMNENYFGDNIYADYFTPDRVESFDAARESVAFPKESQKDGLYIWGESSQKDSEFVLPNFIHESYKIAESSGVEYVEVGERADAEGDTCERDSKVDVLSDGRSESEAPLNICADERMPPRGELSGQESNGDMESPWSGMYTEVTPAEPYDLIARESWVSDGSEIDTSEKRDNLEEDLPKPRLYTCSVCRAKFTSLKEMRSHKALAHAAPTCSGASYSRLVTARSIKKEEKTDVIMPGAILLPDSKESIASTMLQVYDAIESKPAIETLIKQEPKRKRKDFVCPTCKVDQGTETAFHAHLKLHPLECLTCGKCFFRRANLALHLKTHSGIKNFNTVTLWCSICGAVFHSRAKLHWHRETHDDKPKACPYCSDKFVHAASLTRHVRRTHNEYYLNERSRHNKQNCGAVFHSRAKLHWHRETHDDKPKACPYCSDKFVHAASLTRHVRRTHNEYYLNERSRHNKQNVYLRTNLRAHLHTHSGKRPYLCIICNKAFTTKWNLKLHRWTHMSRSAKPYKCNLCKGAFIRQTEYISHMNAHKSVRPYTCNYCGCQFVRKYNCQRHVREHEMAKKYVCKVPECGKSFHRSYYLSEHMKVHSGARPFSCNICGKMSSNKSNHNKHVKIHHAREPVASEW
ncbi:hypothetical protein MSG28_008280 [Choristoneura fumiferana]|uniref:Uncharacterized protein n=1 Tax=Choristoneura fumiferana TaxID=7141 RepID=A0ACC0JAS7_CHOFU|nr:hypothetical protein MSG28_008280 [Choristoneura fumiferana]